MEIKCKISRRFLCDIDIEDYYSNLKKMGVDITTPIIIKFACRQCKCIEEYEIYPTHYTLVARHDRQIDKKQ